MIATILTLLIRRYKRTHPAQFSILMKKFRYAAKIFLLIGMALCFGLILNAQERNFSYAVKRNSKTIGTVSLKVVKTGTTTAFKLESNIEASFIFSFTARAIEEAVYDKGILVYSYVYQTMNGSEKVNTKTTYGFKGYTVVSKGAREKLDSQFIYYNLICIYTQEPEHITRLYSDKFQRFLSIQKIGDHHYRIVFPDKNYNDYYYQNGICTKIVVENFLYSAVMELKG